MPTTNNSGSEKVNAQVIDAIKQVNSFLKESDFSLDAIANQLTVHAVGVAMMNIVQQQQQLYTLQNAVTMAAAKSMLNSSPQEAVQLMHDVVKENNLMSSLQELKELLNEIKNIKKSGGE